MTRLLTGENHHVIIALSALYISSMEAMCHVIEKGKARMNYVVAIKGDVQQKVVLVDGSLTHQMIIPFVGARCNGIAEVGMGFLGEAGQVMQFYAPDFFKHILQSWRGMRILEQITHIWDGTLKDCYNAAAPDPTYLEKREFSSLADQIGLQKFDSFLQRMLATMPKPSDLDQILQTMRGAGVHFDLFELQREIRGGKLQPTLLLKSLINQEVEAYKRLNADERAKHAARVRELEDEAYRHRLRVLALAS